MTQKRKAAASGGEPTSKRHLPEGGYFDKHAALRENLPGAPAYFFDASRHVLDTMETAWVVARDVFGEAAAPEHAIAIYSLIDDERRRRAAEADGDDGEI